LVKLGPIGLTFVEFEGQRLIYFSEEFIDGKDLKMVLREDGRLATADAIRLGLHVGRAIDALWKLEKIHRDIKPANIMRRSNGEFILLDAGLVFDLGAETVSVGPVGTRPYFSPEQFDFGSRRTVMDFRSDLFSLGVTMYELLTGVHPFWEQNDSLASLCHKIVNQPAQPPNERCTVPDDLNDIILRLLGKSPHLRYRRCQLFLDALEAVSA
jgi:serine/threonine-protein kinase